MAARRVTMRDIAERAHVSVSTVSYALNDSSTLSLSPDTRARVRRIAKEIGYVPNSWAKALQSRSSGAVGVLLDKPLTLPRYATILEGMRRVLRENDIRLVLMDSRGGEVEHSAVEDYRAGRVDGLVVVGHDDVATSQVIDEAVARYSLPFVALDCGAGAAPFSTIEFDYARGVRELVGHLHDRGITHLVHVRPTADARAERERQAELLRVVSGYSGLTLQVVRNGIDDELLMRSDQLDGTSLPLDRPRFVADLGQVLGALREQAATTAVICSWGTDLEIVVWIAHRISPDLLVAGLAQGPLEQSLWPNLVHSVLPLREAGALCAEAVVGELREPPTHRHEVLVPVLRASDPLL
ncbi:MULTISPECIES: LacI family DNA-binding transcriptional regulator [Actinomyces]|uniref:LacI family DNA-binding transcriptional regulator n=1 Tax=Actinomyces respiraculi TaxID=2744574 RepID=A0A7T0LLD1_9ACTO|nr:MULTISPECIES: LacI family DNA-binding transcriptional regulator [Actinomyces]QPL05909.1 LacI family DNA-binding transcriptional regulator [Actinomyces respiraculi]